MKTVLFLAALITAGLGQFQDDSSEDDSYDPECYDSAFNEELTGFYPDPEQCDLYYVCNNGKLTEVPKQCQDGLLFDEQDPTAEKCDYPFNVDCGAREFISEPEPGLDSRCPRANGFFAHNNTLVCNKYFNCVRGYPYEYNCAGDLVFDEAQGTCVREEQASTYARICERPLKETVDGFSCPDGQTFGPNNQPLAHPSFQHPTNCREYINCQGGTKPVKLGCLDGDVFDPESMKCVLPEEGPDDCKCWYPETGCPDICSGDCDTACNCL